MRNIICALRGGPASQSTIAHAIALAQQKAHQLTFLYVVNLDFLSHTMKSRTASMVEDIRQMGEMILLMAVETAAASGVDAQMAVREGEVAEQIVMLCAELNADYVVVGAPLLAHQMDVFTMEQVQTLSSELSHTCQAELVIVA